MIYEYSKSLPNAEFETLAELAVHVIEQGNYTSMKVGSAYYALSQFGITGEITQDEAEGQP